MDWKNLFTSFDRRISRQPFWIGTIILLAIDIASEFAFDAFFGEGSPNAVVRGVIRDLVLLYPNLAIATKRWHDRDKSGWWSLLVVITFLFEYTTLINYINKSRWWHLLWIAPTVASTWYLVECGFLRGTSGPNRFGPDPLSRPGRIAAGRNIPGDQSKS